MIAKIIKFLVTIMKGGTMQDFIVNFDKSQKLGIYLKQLREKNNLTIREVKKRTGINTADLSRIESGLKERINPFHLLELSKTYKISVLELYFMIGYLNKNSLIEYNAQNTCYPPIIIKAKDKFSILGLCVEKIFQKSII